MSLCIRLLFILTLCHSELFAGSCERVLWKFSDKRADPSWTERATIMWFPSFPTGPSYAGHTKLALNDIVYNTMENSTEMKTMDTWARSPGIFPRHFHFRFTLRASADEIHRAQGELVENSSTSRPLYLRGCSGGTCAPLVKAGIINFNGYSPAWVAARMLYEGLTANPRLDSISVVGRNYLRSTITGDTLTEVASPLLVAGFLTSLATWATPIYNPATDAVLIGSTSLAAVLTSRGLFASVWGVRTSRAKSAHAFEAEKRKMRHRDPEEVEARMREAWGKPPEEPTAPPQD